MDIEHKTSKFKNILTADAKSFIGLLLSITGMFFILLGVMVFVALIIGIYFQLGIFVVFIIATLIVGVLSFAVGSTLYNNK